MSLGDYEKLSNAIMNLRKDDPNLPEPAFRFSTEDEEFGAWDLEDGSCLFVPWLEKKQKWAWGRRFTLGPEFSNAAFKLVSSRTQNSLRKDS